MEDWLGRPFRSVPRQVVPPLKISLSRKLKEVVEEKYTKAGVKKGRYIVIHGIQSDSKATMQSRGDPDSLLPLEVWAEIADAVRYEMLPSNIESLLAYFYKFSIIAYENSLELIFSLFLYINSCMINIYAINVSLSCLSK